MNLFPATAALLPHFQQQPSVLGVISLGSKSRGYADDRSDDDLEVVLTHSAFAHRSPSACIEHHVEHGKLVSDVRYVSLEHLQRKQSSFSDNDHWPYEQAKVLFDRYETVQRTVELLGHMDTDFQHKRIAYSTMSTTIAIGKACKAIQRGYTAAGQLTLARGAKTLARVLFALERRWTPTDHWLERELETLADPAHAGPMLVQALLATDPLLLRKAIQQIEITFPDTVPDREERAKLYVEAMHPTHSEERAIHVLV